MNVAPIANQKGRVAAHERVYRQFLEKRRYSDNLGCITVLRRKLRQAGLLKELSALEMAVHDCLRARRDLAADEAVLNAVSVARSHANIAKATFNLIADWQFLVKRSAWSLFEKSLTEWTQLGTIENYRLIYVTLTRSSNNTTLEHHFGKLADCRSMFKRRLRGISVWSEWYVDVHESGFAHIVFLVIIPEKYEKKFNTHLDGLINICYKRNGTNITTEYSDRDPSTGRRRNGAMLDLSARKIQWCMALAYATKIFSSYRSIKQEIAEAWGTGVSTAQRWAMARGVKPAFRPRVFAHLLRKPLHRRTDSIATWTSSKQSEALETEGDTDEKITEKITPNRSSRSLRLPVADIKGKLGRKKKSKRGAPVKLFGKRALKNALRDGDGNVPLAAAKLGISEETMRKNMERHDLQGRPRGRPPKGRSKGQRKGQSQGRPKKK